MALDKPVINKRRNYVNPFKNSPIFLYYWANWLYRYHFPFLPKLLQMQLFFGFGAVVPYKTKIGPGCRLAHGGNGIVIHSKAQIGRNVIIHPQVTIGGTGRSAQLPVIGDDVYIGTGAKILGPVNVGNNTVIGANAVVVHSVPACCVAAGVPAHIIRENVDAHSVEIW